MKKVFWILIILLFSTSALAIFSAFEVIKPGADHAKRLELGVKHTKNLDSCIIEFLPFGYDQKHAWLVVSSRPLSEKEQLLRNYIWGESPRPGFIELIVKLNPMKYKPVDEKSAKDARYMVTLKSELAKRSYVYIDFPQMVFDGGYYYSIPLGEFCGKK